MRETWPGSSLVLPPSSSLLLLLVLLHGLGSFSKLEEALGFAAAFDLALPLGLLLGFDLALALLGCPSGSGRGPFMASSSCFELESVSLSGLCFGGGTRESPESELVGVACSGAVSLSLASRSSSDASELLSAEDVPEPSHGSRGSCSTT